MKLEVEFRLQLEQRPPFTDTGSIEICRRRDLAGSAAAADEGVGDLQQLENARVGKGRFALQPSCVYLPCWLLVECSHELLDSHYTREKQLCCPEQMSELCSAAWSRCLCKASE